MVHGSGIRNSIYQNLNFIHSAPTQQPPESCPLHPGTTSRDIPSPTHSLLRLGVKGLRSAGFFFKIGHQVHQGLSMGKLSGGRISHFQGVFVGGGWYFILEWFLEPKTSVYIYIYSFPPKKSWSFVGGRFEFWYQQKLTWFLMQSLQITAVAGGNGNLSEDSPRPKYMPCLKCSTVRQLSEKKNTMKLGAFKPETPEVLKKNSKNEKQMHPFVFQQKLLFGAGEQVAIFGRWRKFHYLTSWKIIR